MFTGIVQTLGTVVSSVSRAKGIRLALKPARPLRGLKIGESIAVNGVCLTLVRSAKGRVEFDVIPETLRLTNLKQLKAGDRVNLERALRHGDRLSGHYVLGHVEAKAKILDISKTKRQTEVRIELPKKISRRVLLKGCIAIDGISLTVSRRSPKAFSVHVIPHSWTATNLKFRKPGDRVNLESDSYLKKLSR